MKEEKSKMAENQEEVKEQLETNQEMEGNENSTKSMEELTEELKQVKEENQKYYEHLQRTAAEFDNYKKRVTKEKESIYSLAVGDVITKYIPMLDNFEKALNAETTDQNYKNGIEMIYKQTLEIMKEFHVEPIPTVKEKFNPEYHDAVMHVESDEYGEKIILEELRKGYKMGDRVLRHAMVKVAN